MVNDSNSDGLNKILKHMKLMEERIVGEIGVLKNGQQAIKIDLTHVKDDLGVLQKSVMKQNDVLEERIDEVETIVLGNKHEDRILKLEQHVGLAA